MTNTQKNKKITKPQSSSTNLVVGHWSLGFRNSNKGFTLIEVIFALGIFAVGIVAILALFPKGIILGRQSKETTVAANLAQEKTEEYISQNYDDIPIGNIEVRLKADSDPNSQLYKYERSVTVEYVDSNLSVSIADTGLKKIVTDVYWKESGREKSLQIVRLLNKK
ncbi:hypothetical protein COX95_01270 [bacterium CG_4_10_14_0_2_um_filter_33_32]|nr:MAG: hypothetical protein AUJ93_00835 [bacterium CG2_30_33_46]PIR67261.1 MAG: hypothetical protein COU50_04270 [bacterium CG10_big_fil_rev_8_21_14_0_10_33_18]PIU76602.1 MAG: hypothetical protein COS74_03275 [bacterium CG06_land_8_20_14_3_00_33_50]PIW81737.1 MAG: hypothetical protein COZ97_00300 [bacterium CG_4_8_14_3_um_filter_33_28]PIY85102.1 MAG: hypothetical protein COY76_04015 [bacterium CG_4_10_14_0_8_um_filter_33_57]PIZ86434.1 MAG: hypothetical protein COX95_01270 [bacterium CG_4_10_1